MTYVTYSRTGPFVDNGSPPIDHVFLNAVETFLAAGWFDSLITSDGSGHLTLANNTAYRAKDSGGTARDVLWIDGSNQTNLIGIAGTDLIFFKQSNGTVIASAGTAGINLDVGGFNFLTSPVTVNGSVSGTASAYQIMRGTAKLTYVYLNAWRSASAVNITLPVAYTTGAWVKTGGVGPSTDGGYKLLASGTPQTIRVVTALSANGGTISSVTQMYENSIGECVTAFDTVAVWSNTNSHSGFIILEGI